MMATIHPISSKYGKQVSVSMPAEQYELLKQYATTHGITLRAALERAVDALLGV